ncbi:glycosyltransferase family 2 protein [Aquimarina pacifica]|uniref:glycosyltransferase family 2 protein n=1 Tax=Aquimarina pacifica TaxID=1296415 RepID=UPI0004718E91|nr:glycosyltransferase family A protein [Aquimarina pacifica]
MTVSVIIPTYNSEQFIIEALQSVYDQNFAFNEVICIDDASTDNTISLIKKKFPEVLVFSNSQNSGPSFSRNKGIKLATGTVLAFLDSDDIWPSNKIKEQLQQLTADPSLEIIGGLTSYFFMPESIKRKETEKLETPHFNAHLGSLLIKKNVFSKVGAFDETLRLSEDQDWFLRVREAKTSMKIIDKVTLNYRVHNKNSTNDLSFKGSGILEVLKKSLDRRRFADQLKSLDPIIINHEK